MKVGWFGVSVPRTSGTREFERALGMKKPWTGVLDVVMIGNIVLAFAVTSLAHHQAIVSKMMSISVTHSLC